MYNQLYMQANYTPLDTKKKQPQSVPVSPTKEAEPLSSKTEFFQIEKTVEHKITDEEVKQHVEERKENIELSPDLKTVGVETTSSPQFSTTQTVNLPLSDDKVVQGLHAPLTSSVRWLATLAVYILKQAHMTLKTVHGKVMRVQDK